MLKYGVIDDIKLVDLGNAGVYRQHIILEGEVEDLSLMIHDESFHELVYDSVTNLTYLPLVSRYCMEYNETNEGNHLSYYIDVLENEGFTRDDSILNNLNKGTLKLIIDGDINLSNEDYASIRIEYDGFDRDLFGDCAELVVPYPILMELISYIYVEDDMLIPELEEGLEALIKFSEYDNVKIIQEF